MNAEAVVDAAVASDVVPEEDTELAALVEYFTAADLTLDYLTAPLHSPLGNFCHLRRSLHPSLQVGSLVLHPTFQVGLSQLLLIFGGGGSGSILLLCQGFGQFEAICNVKTKYDFFTIFQTSMILVRKKSEAI